MLIPIYFAEISQKIYGPIVEWYNEVTYTRPQPADRGMEEHFADEYSQSLTMYPRMSDFRPPYEADDNNGNGLFKYNERVVFDTPSTLFPGSNVWDITLLTQAQLPLWMQHKAYMAPFIEAYEARGMEDTWFTQRILIRPADYEYETTTVSWNRSDPHDAARQVWATLEEPLTGSLDPELRATPCNMTLSLKGQRKTYRLRDEISNVLAFYDEWEPDAEPVPWEVIPDARRAIITSLDKWNQCTVPPAAVRLINGQFLWEIQPARFEAELGAVYNFPMYTIGETLYEYPIPAVASEAELQPPLMAVWAHRGYTFTPPEAGEEFADILSQSRISLANVPTYYDSPDFGKLGISSGGGRYPIESIAVGMDSLYDVTYQVDLVRYIVDGGLVVDTVYGPLSIGARPKAWNHLDPEFIGYVPYAKDLWDSQLAYVKQYANNPDARFNGFYFEYKVKISSVTRAWQAYTHNVLEDTEVGFTTCSQAILDMKFWYDTATNEYLPATGACYGIGSVTVANWLTPTVAGVGLSDFDWGDFEFPSVTIELPPGTFFLEDGSAAPIYPSFYGAYVYDLHLKKWGKFDDSYKRLIDYSAINTYMPAQQSFARFGIFGGILVADGKIKLFDENPTESWIKYGKIGFYRQGMTRLEEVRIHHRIPVAGSLTIESSLEGKLVSPALAVTENYASSPYWRRDGGYAARWHSLTIGGKFDLSYLEFRGVITGRR